MLESYLTQHHKGNAMSLSQEWFEHSKDRYEKRLKSGLPVKEAEDCLGAYMTSAYPIALEVADFIYENWTVKDIYKLNAFCRELLINILEKRYPEQVV